MNRRQKLIQQQFLNNEQAVITRLQYIYDRSLFDINEKIRNLEFRIGDLTEEYEWADDADKDRIKSMIQSKIYQKQYQEQLQVQIEGVLKQMQTKQYLTVSDYLDECYEDGFIGGLFDLHGQGVPLAMPINQESLVRAVQLDSKISQGLYTRLGEDVATLKKRIAAEITRGIATGSSYSQVARQLANQTRIGYNKSIRIARTEGHRIQNQAIMDSAQNATERGADLVKQWDATLDGKTRESHVAVDGEIRELNEKFSNGLEYPGDPAGSAAEVVNCRCAMLQRARWAVGGSFTKWNNFTKQLETFESPEAYDEFKKGFFDPANKKYMNYVQQMEEKYNTRDFTKVLDRMNDREYAHYSKLLENNPLYNKKAAEVIDPFLLEFDKIEGKHYLSHDVHGTNPKYRESVDYRTNCQRCCPAFEMRQRGYDVVAKPYDAQNKYLAHNPAEAFKDPIIHNCSRNGKTDIVNLLTEWGDGARAEVRVVWKNEPSAHVFMALNRGGNIIFVDPQSGNMDASDYFKRVKAGKTSVWRIDNLEMSDLIFDCCERRIP